MSQELEWGYAIETFGSYEDALRVQDSISAEANEKKRKLKEKEALELEILRLKKDNLKLDVCLKENEVKILERNAEMF